MMRTKSNSIPVETLILFKFIPNTLQMIKIKTLLQISNRKDKKTDTDIQLQPRKPFKVILPDRVVNSDGSVRFFKKKMKN